MKPAGKAKISPRDGPNMLKKIKGPQKGFYRTIQRIEISPVCPKLLNYISELEALSTSQTPYIRELQALSTSWKGEGKTKRAAEHEGK